MSLVCNDELKIRAGRGTRAVHVRKTATTCCPHCRTFLDKSLSHTITNIQVGWSSPSRRGPHARGYEATRSPASTTSFWHGRTQDIQQLQNVESCLDNLGNPVPNMIFQRDCSLLHVRWKWRGDSIAPESFSGGSAEEQLHKKQLLRTCDKFSRSRWRNELQKNTLDFIFPITAGLIYDIIISDMLYSN